MLSQEKSLYNVLGYINSFKVIIIESVDYISRDGLDMPIIILKITVCVCVCEREVTGSHLTATQNAKLQLDATSGTSLTRPAKALAPD